MSENPFDNLPPHDAAPNPFDELPPHNDGAFSAALQAIPSALVSPVTGAAMATPEGRGVGQGVIQGATFGYGMPLLRKAIPGSQQVPPPTAKEALVGEALSIPVGVGEFNAITNAAKAIPVVGKVAQAMVPAAVGAASNPSSTSVIPIDDPRRGLGAGLGVAGQAASGIASVVNPEAISALTKAIRPGKWDTNFSENAAKALPAIQETKLPVKSLDDFIDAVKVAKRNVWSKIQSTYDSARSQSSKVFGGIPMADGSLPRPNTVDTTATVETGFSGNKISDGLKNMIDSDTEELSPYMNRDLAKAAKKYENVSMTIDKAEKRLQTLNSELTPFFKGGPIAQNIERNNASVAAKLAERKILRQTLYDHVQSLTGDNVAPLKAQYGALMSMEDSATGRLIVANRQLPISLQEAINGVLGVSKAVAGDMTGLLHIAGAVAVKKINSPNRLVGKAVSNYGRKLAENDVSKPVAIAASRNLGIDDYLRENK